MMRFNYGILVAILCQYRTQGDPYPFEVTGACSYSSDINDMYELVNSTSDGRWFYRGQYFGLFVYFDPDCDGPDGAVGAQDVWLIDSDEPSTVSFSDLDGGGKCLNNGTGFSARINDAGTTPPTGTRTWRVWCGTSVESTDLSIVLIGAPTTSPTVSVQPTLSPTVDTCLDTCFGYDYRYWLSINVYYTCASMESQFGCNCAGCSCNVATPMPTPNPSRAPSVSTRPTVTFCTGPYLHIRR